MDDKKNTGPIVPPMKNDPNLKVYYCPHCRKKVMKGNVKRLSMTCPHCSDLINVDEKELVKTETDEA